MKDLYDMKGEKGPEQETRDLHRPEVLGVDPDRKFVSRTYQVGPDGTVSFQRLTGQDFDKRWYSRF